MAGLDGIQNKINPGEPMDKNIYELPPEEHAKNPERAGSLQEALGLPLERTTRSCSRATSSPKTSSKCGSAQAQGTRRHPPASASVRILPLLRRVKRAWKFCRRQFPRKPPPDSGSRRPSPRKNARSAVTQWNVLK
jgi:hypothetical protein